MKEEAETVSIKEEDEVKDSQHEGRGCRKDSLFRHTHDTTSGSISL